MYHWCTSKNIGFGALSGLIGGIIFGFLMVKMGYLARLGGIIGLPNQTAGFCVHLILSTFMGIVFALLFFKLASKRLSAAIWGVIYGILWWFLGPLTLLPSMLGKPTTSMWNLASVEQTLPSLFGHIIFGILLGTTYGWLRFRDEQR